MANGLLSPVEQQTQAVFGMVPMEERLSLLPRYSKSQGLIAPQFIYDLAKAVSTPIVAMRGQQVSPEETLNTAISSFGGSAAGVAPKGSVRSGLQRTEKGAKKTEFEIANEIAQRNATQMLGLPANNTAMDRAKALGFDINTIRYHGSDKDIKAFDPAKFGKHDQGWYGRGVTTDTDPEIASGYANYNEAANGQVVYPLLTKGKHMVWPEDQPPFASAKDSIVGTKDIQSLGYSGTVFKNDRDLYGVTPNWGEEQVTFNPSFVRSRFAAFDPARINEADLLAMGGSPLPLGLLGSNNKEKKQEKKPKK